MEFEPLENPIHLPLKLKYRTFRSFKCGKYAGGNSAKKKHTIWWHLSQKVKKGK